MEHEDIYAGQRAMPLIEFVNSLFEASKIAGHQGIDVEMISGNIAHVEVYQSNEKVIVVIDGVTMGRFEETTAQGYKCIFFQQYRVGIRNGLTENEAMMESICEHPLIRLNKAY